MERCGHCDCQCDIDNSEDEKEDYGSAQPAPPTKSRFHRLPPISTSRPLSRCHPPPAGVVLPGKIDGHTLLSAPMSSLFPYGRNAKLILEAAAEADASGSGLYGPPSRRRDFDQIATGGFRCV